MSAIFSPMMHLFAVLDELFSIQLGEYTVNTKQGETPVFSMKVTVPNYPTFEVSEREATKRNISELIAKLYQLYK